MKQVSESRGLALIWLMAGCQLLAAGCATTTEDIALVVDPCPRGALAVEVSEGGGPMIPGVSCKIRGRLADISCPTTDSIARTCFDPKVLLDPDTLAVEFCKDGYFCGAFRMEDERSLLPGMDLGF